MKTIIALCLLSLFSIRSIGQTDTDYSFKDDIKSYRLEQNDKFKNEKTSPLKATDRSTFKKLKYYRAKRAYRVIAKFIRTTDAKPFEMPTTTDRKPMYEKFGELHFEIKGQQLKLDIFQSHNSRRNPLYRDYLFLPFKDATNTKKTYGGGRFIDLRIPKGDTVIINFNKAYNPYCAYSPKYSCPVVPMINHLKVAIPAGIKKYKK